jgi:hypothetical protein
MTRLAQGVAAVPAMAATSSRTQSLHSLHTKPLGMLRSKSRRKPHPRRAGMRGFLEYVDDWIGESGYYHGPRLLLRSPLLAG